MDFPCWIMVICAVRVRGWSEGGHLRFALQKVAGINNH